MKYLEFVYLFAALFLVAYLSIRMQDLNSTRIIILFVAIAFAAFQYGFRRQVRRRQEQEKERSEG